jgi:putative transposase
MKRVSHSRSVAPSRFAPAASSAPLDLLVDTRAELMDLAVASGLKVLHTMLEADRTAVCGPRYAHEPDRAASRAGTVASEVVLGGRKMQIRRPRVRAAGAEAAPPTFEAFADTDR